MHFSFSTATFLAIFAASASAYSPTGRTFAVNHFYGDGPLVIGRMDPIINPGTASGHVHAVQGGNNFALTMTNEQALDSTCTSSLVKNDKSNYWTPTLYFLADNGSFISVPMFYMNVYYFFEATTDKIEAFQPGHRMVIGNPNLRSPPASGGGNILDLSQGTPQPIQWTCPRTSTNEPLYPTNSDGVHGVGIQDPNNAGAGAGFPDQNCDGYASPLRADIHFPSCYDKSKDITDYKNNMVFPTNGNCPTGFTHTPHLFYEVYWNTPLFEDLWTPGQGKQPFVLSNGDPTGYGLHGDFISGWDQATLQQIIDNCDAGDSGMDKCPGLIGGLNDPSDSCNIKSAIVEDIFGVLPELPGNNPLGAWGVPVGESSPAPPVESPEPSTSETPAKSSSQTPASTPVAEPSSAISVGGGDKEQSTPTVIKTTTPVDASSPGETSSAVSDGGGDREQSTSTVVKTTAPVDASSPGETFSAITTIATVVPTTIAGAGNTIITSYVTETAVVWTTVTAPAPAPTLCSSSSSSMPAPAPAALLCSSSSSKPAIGSMTYHGCYSDALGNGNRVMSGIQLANIGTHQVTNTKCVTYCAGKGYSMAGTEYGGQCFCSNTLASGTMKLNDTKCNMACEGDGSETCGGSLALTVYSTKSASKRRRERHEHQHQHAHGSS